MALVTLFHLRVSTEIPIRPARRGGVAMLSLIRRPAGPGNHRRGVTLVEMLVVVALVVLMMVILVQIFQAATGAMTASRTITELDVNLRQLDSIIRSDLNGVTAKMTPPNDPANFQGYFEYGENEFADAQGEDTDDYLAFTTKAPEGQSFSGRQWLLPSTSFPNINQSVQPTTITSQVAEVIYFLRNGNLYRRVFLVVPERSKTIQIGPISGGFITGIFGGSLKVSWLGMNDISCRPNTSATIGINPPIPNDLSTLTNRENRAFRPRFVDDVFPKDGIPDDNNGDGVHDYYPTLYFDGGHGYQGTNGFQIWSPNHTTSELVGYPNSTNVRFNQSGGVGSTSLYAFPFIYPGMYSVPSQYRRTNNLGWIHEVFPYSDKTLGLIPNQAPLDVGDNLSSPRDKQTWWGFPTWRETMAGVDSGGGVGWRDPVGSLAQTGYVQPAGLIPPLATDLPTDAAHNLNLLPPVYLPGSATTPFSFDTNGSANFVAAPLSGNPLQSISPDPLWEDDLLQTNVRSFDIKAYDTYAAYYNIQSGPSTYTNGPFSAGYQDLGYGSTGLAGSGGISSSTYIGGPNGTGVTSQTAVLWQAVGGEPVGFGHEGRIPPLPTDFRYQPGRAFNVGNANPAVQRLTRVWDSWSTTYSGSPTPSVIPNSDVLGNNATKYDPPIYPSFPPPYPSPLRGIQIQIRIADPRNERAKTITIRHDFTDRL